MARLSPWKKLALQWSRSSLSLVLCPDYLASFATLAVLPLALAELHDSEEQLPAAFRAVQCSMDEWEEVVCRRQLSCCLHQR